MTTKHQEEIYQLIPHRPPFLWIDRIIARDADNITTEKTIDRDLPLFAGHYPGNPIMPGVLLLEAIFQSGALLMAGRLQQEPDGQEKIPVLTRISSAKFKQAVFPGDTVTIEVGVTERIGSAAYFKGSLKVGGNRAVQVQFACSIATGPLGGR